jgi:hypothetical protein
MALPVFECRDPRLFDGPSGELLTFLAGEPVCREVSRPASGPMSKASNVTPAATFATRAVSFREPQAFQQPAFERDGRVRPRCYAHEKCSPIHLPRTPWTAPLESIAFERECPVKTPGSRRKFVGLWTKDSAARKNEQCPRLHRKDAPVRRNTGAELWKLWNSLDEPKPWNEFQGKAHSHSTPYYWQANDAVFPKVEVPELQSGERRLSRQRVSAPP